MLPGQRRQRHDPSRSFPLDLRCQHGSTRFTQVGLPFPVLQGSPRWFLTCQKPPERPPVHPGPSGIIPVHHGGTTVQPTVLPGSPRSMDRGEPGSTGSPVGLGHYVIAINVSRLETCRTIRQSSRHLIVMLRAPHGHRHSIAMPIPWHRCQPSRNRAGNPAFCLISRIPAFLRERPAFLALFRNIKIAENYHHFS